MTAFVVYTPEFKDVTKNFSHMFYLYLFLLSLVSSIFSFFNFVSIGAFYAKITDKLIGGCNLRIVLIEKKP